MKILFIENRYFTWILDTVAKGLQASGHDIHWIVQNPMFTPKTGHIHLLSFPKSSAANKVVDSSWSWLRESDRGVRWFGGNGAHWEPYHRQISEIIRNVLPDVVFCEMTQFHELLTLDVCKELGIPLLSPNVTRYPVGRLHFLANDTLDPVGGRGVNLTDPEVDEMLNAINSRTLRPSYMEPITQSKLNKITKILTDKVRILTGWFIGERYVTPSPWVKMQLERKHARQYMHWESFAHQTLPDAIIDKPWVLLPLQMQPEANIEVWGRPWSDQTDLVKRTAKALEHIGAVLVVKPNPKSKYELMPELCDLVARTPNIVAISHTTPMKAVFAQAPLVMTVTGTVLLECVFSGKPVASLGSHAMTRYPGVKALNTPEEVASVLEKVLNKEIVGASREEAKGLLNFLYKTSYPAMIWDPLNRPELMTTKNIGGILSAFVDILNIYEKKITDF
ncbi:hypothetical protein ACXX82_08640 [Glaciimonas sp. GNP009]